MIILTGTDKLRLLKRGILLLITLCAAAVILPLGFADVSAGSDCASVFFRTDVVPGEASEAGVDVTVDNAAGSAARTFDITVTISDITAWAEGTEPAQYQQYDAITRSVQTAAGEKKVVSIDTPRKGFVKIEVTVKSDGSVVLQDSRELCLIEYYKRQFLDEYSSIGFNGIEEKDIDLAKKAGIFYARKEVNWYNTERMQGVYNFSDSDKAIKLMDVNGINTLMLLDYSNDLYIPTPDSDSIQSNRRANYMGAYTKEQVDAFIEFAKEAVRRYPEVKTVEIYNEPSFSYWQPHNDYKGADYATFLKAVAMALREERPDISIIGGSFAFGGSPTAYRFMDDFFKEGALKYVDGVSYHPYYGNDPYITVDAGDVDSIVNPPYSEWLGGIGFIAGKLDEQIYKNGGFKDVLDTEIGFNTTADEALTAGEKYIVQAKSTVKQFLYEIEFGRQITTVYNFRDSGTDPNNSEHNLGIVMNDGTPKPAYAAVSQLSNVLSGAVFIGNVNLGEAKIKAQLYEKNGELMIAAWTLQDYTTDAEYITTIDLPHKYAEDMYGNAVEVLRLTSEPIYIMGISKDFYANSVLINAPQYYEKLLKKINNDEISELNEASATLKALPSSEYAAELLDKNYKLGIDMAKRFYNGELNVSDSELMAMLFDLHNAGQQLAHLYAAALAEEGKTAEYSGEQISKAEEKIGSKLNKLYYTQMPISQELLRQAARHNEKAEFVANTDYYPNNTGKITNLTYEQILSDKLTEWASYISEFEKVDDYASVLMYTNFDGRPAQNKMDIQKAKTASAEIMIDNSRRTKAMNDIRAAVFDDMDRKVSETETFTIGSAKTGTIPVEVYVPGDLEAGKHIFKVALIADGEIVSSRGLGVNVLDAELGESFLSDIFTVKWAEEAINKMVELGVINGIGDNRFAPNDPVSREQFTKMVVELFDISQNISTCSFNDVDKDAWYFRYIAAAEAAGIIRDSKTEFGVGHPITRQDMALMLAAALEMKGISFENSQCNFTDLEQIRDYARQGVIGLAENGVISGYEDNTFRPLNNSTRAEAAQMLYNVYKSNVWR